MIVDFTPGGDSDLTTLPLNARFDVIFKLTLVEQVGLGGELKIGEIAPHVTIYLLYSGNHHVAVAHDHLVHPSSCHVVAVEPYARIDLAMKTAFVNAAVRETGIASRVVVF